MSEEALAGQWEPWEKQPRFQLALPHNGNGIIHLYEHDSKSRTLRGRAMFQDNNLDFARRVTALLNSKYYGMHMKQAWIEENT
tara:strand:+ start:589 stop:837 length:249 start_codon:yes stop_codon:yes gene_type:complete